MDKATALYQEMIDDFVKLTKNCVNADNVKNGHVPGIHEGEINAILKKLTALELETLSEYVRDAYMAGIFDVLQELEWRKDCRSMTITVEDETLPLDKFEGIPNDFIGRCEDWEWPEE